MKIVECLWKEQFVEKLERKHQVFTDEVEAVFRNAPRCNFVSKGHVAGENVYWALGQTRAVFDDILYLQRWRDGNANLGT